MPPIDPPPTRPSRAEVVTSAGAETVVVAAMVLDGSPPRWTITPLTDWLPASAIVSPALARPVRLGSAPEYFCRNASAALATARARAHPAALGLRLSEPSQVNVNWQPVDRCDPL